MVFRLFFLLCKFTYYCLGNVFLILYLPSTSILEFMIILSFEHIIHNVPWVGMSWWVDCWQVHKLDICMDLEYEECFVLPIYNVWMSDYNKLSAVITKTQSNTSDVTVPIQFRSWNRTNFRWKSWMATEYLEFPTEHPSELSRNIGMAFE